MYEILKKEPIFYNPYYDYQKEGISTKNICLDGYKEKKHPKGPDEYSIDDDFICFVKKDGLFYSKEFSALVLSYHIIDDKDVERIQINNILKDINGLYGERL